MKLLQINVISLAGGTKRSLPVKPVNKLTGGGEGGGRGQTRCIMGDVKMENSQVKTEE